MAIDAVGVCLSLLGYRLLPAVVLRPMMLPGAAEPGFEVGTTIESTQAPHALPTGADTAKCLKTVWGNSGRTRPQENGSVQRECSVVVQYVPPDL